MTFHNQKEYFDYEILNEYNQTLRWICKILLSLRRILTTSSISRQSHDPDSVSISLTFFNMLSNFSELSS